MYVVKSGLYDGDVHHIIFISAVQFEAKAEICVGRQQREYSWICGSRIRFCAMSLDLSNFVVSLIFSLVSLINI